MFSKVRTGVIALGVLGAIAFGASAIANGASNSGATGATGSQGSSSSTARPDPAMLSHGPKDFDVTAVENGFGAGPPGTHP